MIREKLFNQIKIIAKKNPQKIAVSGEDLEITYLELENQINSIANSLIDQYGIENDIIGIRMESNFNALIYILACLKANKTILPLPFEIPNEKVKKISQQMKIKSILIDISNGYKELKYIETLPKSEKNHIETLRYDDNNRTLILMTSGTTGMPKGCILLDKEFLKRIEMLNEKFEFTEDDNFLFSSNYSFDVAYTQILGWIFGSGKVTIQDKNDKYIKTPSYVEKYNVTHLAGSPAVIKEIYDKLADLKSIKSVFVAGEKFPIDLAKKHNNNFKLWNMYGPTEFSIYATYYDVSRYENYKSTPIGKPLNGVEVKIIDKNGKKIENENCEGEIVLFGNGIFSGYYNQNEKTNESLINIDSKIGYRTGDIGYLREGNLFFIGRKDNQIKINGVRVEAEEIENSILENIHNVKNCVVTYEDYNERKILVAFIVLKNGIKMNLKEIQKVLKGKLENYYIPKYFIELEEIPLNKNGKIDKETLNKIFQSEFNKQIDEKEYHLDAQFSEMKLKRIWEEILEIKIDNEKDDFFMLGGDSLDAVILQSKIEENFGIEINENDLLSNSEFIDLYKLILGKNNSQNTIEEKFSWKDLGLEICCCKNTKSLTVPSKKSKRIAEILNKEIEQEQQVDHIFVDQKSKQKNLEYKKIKQTFPLFSRQEFYLRKNYNSILKEELLIENPIISKVFLALDKFRKSQQLLNCVIKNREFVEYDVKTSSILNTEVLDITDTFDLKEKQNLLNDWIKENENELMQSPLEESLVKFLIVFETLKKIKIIILASHHIADAASLNIFKKQIATNYSQKNEINYIPKYSEFVAEARNLNDEMTMEKFVQSEYYKNILKSNKLLREKFYYNFNSEFSFMKFELPKINKVGKLNFLFEKIVKQVYQTFKSKHFTFQILKNLGEYNQKDYSNIFADIHCSIYSTVDMGNTNRIGLFEQSEKELKTIYIDSGIHIDYLSSSEKFYEDSRIKGLEEVLLNINYLGEIAEIEVENLVESLSKVAKNLAKLHTNKIRFACFTSDGMGYIICLGGLVLKGELDDVS